MGRWRCFKRGYLLLRWEELYPMLAEERSVGEVGERGKKGNMWGIKGGLYWWGQAEGQLVRRRRALH